MGSWFCGKWLLHPTVVLVCSYLTEVQRSRVVRMGGALQRVAVGQTERSFNPSSCTSLCDLPKP